MHLNRCTCVRAIRVRAAGVLVVIKLGSSQSCKHSKEISVADGHAEGERRGAVKYEDSGVFRGGGLLKPRPHLQPTLIFYDGIFPFYYFFLQQHQNLGIH